MTTTLGFKEVDTDIGSRYLTLDYIINNYSNLIPEMKNGKFFGWGMNQSGQLGLGNKSDSLTPVETLSKGSNWKECLAGFTSLGIKTDGTLWSWGYNYAYTLGDGTNVYKSSPIQVGTGTSWYKLPSNVLGYYVVGAIDTTGTFYAFGTNTYGQFGNGGVGATYSTPSVAFGGKTVKQVAIGADHIAILCPNGDIFTSGRNFEGQIGDNTNTYRSSPILISGPWLQISCGESNTYGIKSDGTLWGWGTNLNGQLCDGSNSTHYTPYNIMPGSTWKQVSGGQYFFLAIKSDGTLWGAGQNNYGQLGSVIVQGYYTSPIQISSSTNWQKVCCGYTFSMGLKTDGTIWAWGQNTNGSVGDGTTIDRSSPVQIGTNSKWKNISAGYLTGLGILDEGW